VPAGYVNTECPTADGQEDRQTLSPSPCHALVCARQVLNKHAHRLPGQRLQCKQGRNSMWIACGEPGQGETAYCAGGTARAAAPPPAGSPSSPEQTYLP